MSDKADLISKEGWECQNRQVYLKRHVDKRLADQAAEIERYKAGLIKLAAALLLKRPYPDCESGKVEMRGVIEKAAEDMRLLGIEATNLHTPYMPPTGEDDVLHRPGD